MSSTFFAPFNFRSVAVISLVAIVGVFRIFHHKCHRSHDENCQPKPCIIIREIPEHYHRFASSWWFRPIHYAQNDHRLSLLHPPKNMSLFHLTCTTPTGCTASQALLKTCQASWLQLAPGRCTASSKSLPLKIGNRGENKTATNLFILGDFVGDI